MQEWKLQPARDLGMPLQERARSLRRESGLIESGVQVTWWALVRAYLGLCHRLQVLGREHLPSQPPFVLVANHASHLDAMVLGSPFSWRLRDRIFPLAAGDTFFEKPAMAIFAAWAINAFPIWRKKVGAHALQELRQRLLEEPCSYILFPEGTRSRDGAMTSFKKGLGMLVAETQVPVVPCHLQGTYKALPPNRSIPRFRPIVMRIGPPLVFAYTKNDQTGWKDVAAATEKAVRRLAGEEL